MNPSDYTDCDIDKMQQIDNENYQNRYHDKSVKDYSSDVGKGPETVSYTHLTLPTTLVV